jgi:tetratricopeptide (TPR) repeat protein
MDRSTSKFSKYSLILYFLFFLVFSSCTSHESIVSTQPNLEGPRQDYARGDLQKAIEGYSAALKNYPDETAVLEDYSKVLEDIRQSADNAFHSEDYTLAEQRYSLLLRNSPRFQTIENNLSFDTEYVGHRIKDCLIAQGRGSVQNTFDADDYMNALKAFRPAIQAFPEDSSLKNNLAEALKDLHRRSEKALEKEEYAVAGKMYALLLNENHQLKDLDMSIPFSSESLEDGIKQCRIQLTRKGLELYREEKLKEAVSVWKSLLEFDPGNTEIIKAVGTAEEQLKKIKK